MPNKLIYSGKGNLVNKAKNAITKDKLIKGKEKWITVKSTNLWRISYDQKSRVLKIIFKKKRNAVYNYKDVPGTIYLSLINSVSKGEYFTDKIKHRFGFYIT